MKERNWQKTLSTFQVHTKAGRESFLNELARYYETMYPERVQWFKDSLRQLREVTNPYAMYSDSKGRTYYVEYRIPTELLLFIQRWIPDFGQEHDDIELLKRVFCDLVRPHKDHRRRTLLVTENYRRVEQPGTKDGEGASPRVNPVDPTASPAVNGDGSGQCDHDRQELRQEPGAVPVVLTETLPPADGRVDNPGHRVDGQGGDGQGCP